MEGSCRSVLGRSGALLPDVATEGRERYGERQRRDESRGADHSEGESADHDTECHSGDGRLTRA